MMIYLRWSAIAVLCVATISGALPRAAAEPAVLVTRIIERIPRTEQEVSDAHEKSDLLCTQLPAGVPLAVESFRRQVFYEVKRPAGSPDGATSLLYDWGRWPALSYGTRMTEEDQKSLPTFTGSAILAVVDNTYISIQARVHRAAPDGQPYLYYVPIACIGEYSKTNESVEFAALQQTAVKNVRGLGLFLKPDQPREPSTLRTLVVCIRSSMIVPSDKPDDLQTRPMLELMFVRMRLSAAAGEAAASSSVAGQTAAEEPSARAVELHTFVTADNLAKLAYFKPYTTPRTADDCRLLSTIRITEYSLGGQMPSARAVRKLRIDAAEEFSIAALDEYATRAGLTGTAFDNLTEVLDAIIDGAVK